MPNDRPPGAELVERGVLLVAGSLSDAVGCWLRLTPSPGERRLRPGSGCRHGGSAPGC